MFIVPLLEQYLHKKHNVRATIAPDFTSTETNRDIELASGVYVVLYLPISRCCIFQCRK